MFSDGTRLPIKPGEVYDIDISREHYVYNESSEDRIHLIEISNTPFNRADLAELLDTVEWVQENNYPIRGTHSS